MKQKEFEYLIIASILIFIMITLVLFKDAFSLPSNIDTDFISLFPALFVLFLGITITATVTGPLVSAAMPILGFGMWQLMDTMYTLGYVNDTMLSGLTIDQLGMWCIIFGIILGAIVYISKRR